MSSNKFPAVNGTWNQASQLTNYIESNAVQYMYYFHNSNIIINLILKFNLRYYGDVTMSYLEVPCKKWDCNTTHWHALKISGQNLSCVDHIFYIASYRNIRTDSNKNVPISTESRIICHLTFFPSILQKLNFSSLVYQKQLEKLNHTIHLPNDVILSPIDWARNLGIFFDSNSTFPNHFSAVSKSSLYHIRDLGRIRNTIGRTSTAGTTTATSF